MSAAEAIARVVELVVFAGVNFAFAAGLRAVFRLPRLPERPIAAIAAVFLSSPLILGGALVQDGSLLGLGVMSLALNYFSIAAGLRFTRPS